MTLTDDYLATLNWLELHNIVCNDDLTARTSNELMNLFLALAMHAEERKNKILRLREETRALEAWCKTVRAVKPVKQDLARPVTA